MVEVLIYILGLAVGFIVGTKFNKPKTTEGVLKVRQDEGESYLFLELSQENLHNIHTKDYVVLKVDITPK